MSLFKLTILKVASLPVLSTHLTLSSRHFLVLHLNFSFILRPISGPVLGASNTVGNSSDDAVDFSKLITAG